MSLDRDYHALIVSPRAPGPSPWQACARGWRWRRLRFDVLEQCPGCGKDSKTPAKMLANCDKISGALRGWCRATPLTASRTYEGGANRG